MTPELKVLQDLKWQSECAKSSMPPSYIPKYKYTDKTANGLTRCIIDWLKLNGHQSERISTTGRYIKGRTIPKGFYGVTHIPGKYIKGSGTKGSADISATIKGKSVKIEIKIGKDKQSKEQVEYQQAVEQSGGIYLIAKSFHEFVLNYKNIIESL